MGEMIGEYWIVGIDLAWGERKRDGVSFLKVGAAGVATDGFAYPLGDEELLQCLAAKIPRTSGALLLVDAPIVCPNIVGTRPVDRLTHRMFHREHAACHPANLTKCPRPARVLDRLGELGFRAGWAIGPRLRRVSEVYPHPAMVRLFRLSRIVKYKKGSVLERRVEFVRLCRLIRKLVREEFPELKVDGEIRKALQTAWSKPVEDRVDAFFCALIGLWHWKHGGARSEVIGDRRTGFILLPEDLRGKE